MFDAINLRANFSYFIYERYGNKISLENLSSQDSNASNRSQFGGEKGKL